MMNLNDAARPRLAPILDPDSLALRKTQIQLSTLSITCRSSVF